MKCPESENRQKRLRISELLKLSLWLRSQRTPFRRIRGDQISIPRL